MNNAPWPTASNPCPKNGQHGIKWMTAPLWNVQGKVTKLCLECVSERTMEYEDRAEALNSFTPDPQGSPCKA